MGAVSTAACIDVSLTPFTHRIPRIPTPEDAVFPILIVCTSQNAADNIMLLDPYFRHLNPHSVNDLHEKLQLINPASKAYALLHAHEKYYPTAKCLWPVPMRLIWTWWYVARCSLFVSR